MRRARARARVFFSPHFLSPSRALGTSLGCQDDEPDPTKGGFEIWITGEGREGRREEGGGSGKFLYTMTRFAFSRKTGLRSTCARQVNGNRYELSQRIANARIVVTCVNQRPSHVVSTRECASIISYRLARNLLLKDQRSDSHRSLAENRRGKETRLHFSSHPLYLDLRDAPVPGLLE